MAVRNDFTAGEVLAAADLNDTFASKLDYPTGGNDGDALLKDGASAVWGAAGGSVLVASETITAQSDISINGCFTSAFRNYQIVYDIVASTTTNPQLRLRASGSDATAAEYDFQFLGGLGSSAAAGSLTAQTMWSTGPAGARLYSSAVITVSRPQLATNTFYQTLGNQSNADGASSGIGVLGGSHRAATAYDGFTLIFSTATGTVRVYGLRD
jgi:hypothetical protein